MEAVIAQKVVAAEAAVDEQVVGAAQDLLGGVFSFHGAGGLPKKAVFIPSTGLRKKTRPLVVEPLGHCVGEEAKFVLAQEVVKAADGDAAGVEVDDLLVAFVDSMMGVGIQKATAPGVDMIAGSELPPFYTA